MLHQGRKAHIYDSTIQHNQFVIDKRVRNIKFVEGRRNLTTFTLVGLTWREQNTRFDMS